MDRGVSGDGLEDGALQVLALPDAEEDRMIRGLGPHRPEAEAPLGVIAYPRLLLPDSQPRYLGPH